MTVSVIEWTPDMSVGIDALDEDHKRLVIYLNRFVEAIDRGDGTFAIEAIFSDLFRYTEEHFAREEGVLEVCGYPGLEEHQAIHAQLTEKLLGCRHRYMLSPDKALEEEVRAFLMQWLGEHILKCDMEYQTIVSEHLDDVLEELADE